MKKLGFFIIICLICSILLQSCDEKDGLILYSVDYNIKSPLYTSSLNFDDWCDDNPYIDYSCKLEKKNGKIWVSNETLDNRIWFLRLSYGYIVGVNYNDYDGWVKYYQNCNAYTENVPCSIINQNCMCCLEVNKNEWLILTSNYYAIEGEPRGTLIYCYDKNGGIMFEERRSFEHFPHYMFCLEDGRYIIFTDHEIFLYNFNTDECTVLLTSQEVWEDVTLLAHMRINSCVQEKNILYCGTNTGIYAVDIVNGTEEYYRAEYAEWIDS